MGPFWDHSEKVVPRDLLRGRGGRRKRRTSGEKTPCQEVFHREQGVLSGSPTPFGPFISRRGLPSRLRERGPERGRRPRSRARPRRPLPCAAGFPDAGSGGGPAPAPPSS